MKLFAAALAASLALSSGALALSSTNPTGGSSVQGGTCPTGQAPNGITAGTGAPSGCFTPPSATGMMAPAQSTNIAYLPDGFGLPVTGAAFQDSIHCFPFTFRNTSQTISTLYFRVNTGSSGGLAGFAIYNANAPADTLPSRPGTLVYGVLGSSTATAAIASAPFATPAIPKGDYFTCAVSNNATTVFTSTTPTALAMTRMGGTITGTTGGLVFNNSFGTYGLSAALTSGNLYSTGAFTWPSDLTSTTFSENAGTGGAVPYVLFRFSALTP